MKEFYYTNIEENLPNADVIEEVNYEEIFIHYGVASDHRTCRMSEGSDNKAKAEDEYK